MSENQAVWKNRIVGHGEEAPEQLLAHPLNWRLHPQVQEDALAGVMDDIGWVDEVTVNRRSGPEWPEEQRGVATVVDGHLRIALAISRGEASVPVKYVDLAPAEEAEMLATFDPLGALAAADAEKLETLLRDVQSDSPAVQEMLAELAEQVGLRYEEEPPASDPGPQVDRAAELQEKWQVQPGDLYEVASQTVPGRSHRLLCGDSSAEADVRRLMAGQRAVLFATDPPYLVDYDGTNHPHKWNDPAAARKNKDWSDDYHDWDNSEQGEALYDSFIRIALAEAIVEDAAWYCWHASRNQAMLERVWERYGAFVHQQIIWVKDRPILTRSHYMWQHEPCFFGWIRGKRPKRATDDHPSTVWQVPTIAPGTATDHPTSKPVELFRVPIQQHTEPGELCYEPFVGSGTQIVAAEQLGRICYGLEISPPFVAVT